MVNIPKYYWCSEREKHVLMDNILYWSPRYCKKVYCQSGMESDGATGAFDIKSKSWWVHDKMCLKTTWLDGTPCTNLQASNVLSDILKEEGKWFRARSWWVATFLFGGKKIKKENGWW